jgi:hypothetical protein
MAPLYEVVRIHANQGAPVEGGKQIRVCLLPKSYRAGNGCPLCSPVPE